MAAIREMEAPLLRRILADDGRVVRFQRTLARLVDELRALPLHLRFDFVEMARVALPSATSFLPNPAADGPDFFEGFVVDRFRHGLRD